MNPLRRDKVWLLSGETGFLQGQWPVVFVQIQCRSQQRPFWKQMCAGARAGARAGAGAGAAEAAAAAAAAHTCL